MIIKYLDYITKLTSHIDAIMIVNRKGVVEYSGMYNHSKNRFMDEGVVGKHIFDVYPDLNADTSSHSRVMQSGTPIINESQALKNYHGDTEYLINSTFPILDNDEIIGTIEISVFDENTGGRTPQTTSLYTLDDIITGSSKLIRLKERVARIANSDSSVLLYGETGTGKELFAQSIHTHSKRCKGEFVSLNCAAIPSTLLESTLFGTTSGSFTGAEAKTGLFELADGGTLFLDEINSMAIELQSKLLKVIEEKKFRPVGSNKTIYSDVRIVSAMNIDPKHAVAKEVIRQDLYYRLAIVQLELPPLRQRKEDILLLARHFLSQHSSRISNTTFVISELVENILENYAWPGNVRELRNTIEAATNLCHEDTITVQDLPEHLLYDYETPALTNAIGVHKGTLNEQVRAFERELIRSALQNSKSMADAAKHLGISRQSLRYKMEKHQL